MSQPNIASQSSSPSSLKAVTQLKGLQGRFANALQKVAKKYGDETTFEQVNWLRDEGKHGGGMRLGCAKTDVFNRATINFSQVHYDDIKDKKLRSATALSTIIHPQHPRSPSVHLHFSWTELRDGSGTWRMMADLNPAILDDDERNRFADALRNSSEGLDENAYQRGLDQGEKYFFIPSQRRHRGVFHFYLEGYATEDRDADFALAENMAQAAIDVYAMILDDALAKAGDATAEEMNAQLAYHTLYLFQVLTLDRGTTSGLMVHNQNDVGILGSLPTFVNPSLLATFKKDMPPPQEKLLQSIVNALHREPHGQEPSGQEPHSLEGAVKLTIEMRAELANVLRRHYAKYPEALALQAAGFVTPPTIANHHSTST